MKEDRVDMPDEETSLIRASRATASRDNPCPECGARLDRDAPEGLCPECLLRQALQQTVTAPAADPDLGAGSRIGYLGDYELIREVGRGGMGVVYEARQLSLERTVAVKLLLGGAWSTPPMRERFRREARAAARLQHPNIVAVHEVGEQAEQPFFSMDYVAGKSLEDLVREGPVAPRRAAQLTRAIATAVHFAHQRGVLHRDLKPSNVLLDAQGEPHVTDFGLAKYLSAEPGLTATGELLGTPGFMPPEQVRAVSATDRSAGPASDVYSIGAILYALLTGRPPIQGEGRLETALAVLSSEPDPPRTINPAIPRDLETICLECLETDPARRYRTAGRLADDLGHFLAVRPIAARRAGFGERAWLWLRRRPMPLLAATVVLALLAGLYQTLRWQRARGLALVAQAHAANLSGDLDSAFEAIEKAVELRSTASLREAAIETLTAPGARRTHHFPVGTITALELSADGKFLAASGTRRWTEEWRTWSASGTVGHSQSGLQVWDLSSGDALEMLPVEDRVDHTFAFAGEEPLLARYEVEYIWSERSDAGGSTTSKAVGTAAERVVLWDLASGEPARTFERPGPLSRDSFAEAPSLIRPDGRLLARPRRLDDGKRYVELWHLDDGAIEALPIHGLPLAFVAARELLINSSGRLVRWNLDLGTAVDAVDGATVLAVSADASVAVFKTSGEAPALLFRDLENRQPLGRLAAPVGGAESLLLSPDGDLVALATEDPAEIQVWQLSSIDRGPRTLSLGPSASVVMAQAAFSADGSMLAAFGGEAGLAAVWVWDVDSGREIARLRDQHLPAWAGGRLVTVGDTTMSRGGSSSVGSHVSHRYKIARIRVGNTSASVWEIRPGVSTYRLSRSVDALSVHPGGRQLAANGVVWSLVERDGRYLLKADLTLPPEELAHFDSLGRLWGVEPRERAAVPFRLRRLRPGAASVALEPADYLEALRQDRQARSTATNGRTVAFSPDGKTAVVIADISTIHAGGGGFVSKAALEHWDLETGQRLALWDYDDSHNVAVFSPDGRMVAAGGRLWEVATGRSRALEQNLSQVRYRWSADGKRLFADTRGAALAVLDVETGSQIRSWDSGDIFVRDFALSSDGRWLASGGESVALWDAATGEELLRWPGHAAGVAAVAFLSGDRLLVTGGRDGTLKLWDLDRLRQGLARLGLAG